MDESVVLQVEGLPDTQCFSYDTLMQYNNKAGIVDGVCTLKSAMDTCPANYTKTEFQELLNALGAGMSGLWDAFNNLTVSGNGIEVPAFYGMAETATNPHNDAEQANRTLPGVYIAHTAGHFEYFGIDVTAERFAKSYVIFVPHFNFEGPIPIFAYYDAIDIAFPTVPGLTFNSDMPVSLSQGKSFGKFTNGTVIPSAGKTALEVIQMALQESSVTIVVSPEVLAYSPVTYQDTVEITISNGPASTKAQLIDANRQLVGEVTLDSSGYGIIRFICTQAPDTTVIYTAIVNGESYPISIVKEGYTQDFPLLDLVISPTNAPADTVIKVDIHGSWSSLQIPQTNCYYKKVELYRDQTLIKSIESEEEMGDLSFDFTDVNSSKDSTIYKMVVTDEVGKSTTIERELIRAASYRVYTGDGNVQTTVAFNQGVSYVDNTFEAYADQEQYIYLFTQKRINTIIMDHTLDCTTTWIEQPSYYDGSTIWYVYKSFSPGAFVNNKITLTYD